MVAAPPARLVATQQPRVLNQLSPASTASATATPLSVAAPAPRRIVPQPRQGAQIVAPASTPAIATQASGRPGDRAARLSSVIAPSSPVVPAQPLNPGDRAQGTAPTAGASAVKTAAPQRRSIPVAAPADESCCRTANACGRGPIDIAASAGAVSASPARSGGSPRHHAADRPAAHLHGSRRRRRRHPARTPDLRAPATSGSRRTGFAPLHHGSRRTPAHAPHSHLSRRTRRPRRPSASRFHPRRLRVHGFGARPGGPGAAPGPGESPTRHASGCTARPTPRRPALREDEGRPDEGLPAATALRRPVRSRASRCPSPRPSPSPKASASRTSPRSSTFAARTSSPPC